MTNSETLMFQGLETVKYSISSYKGRKAVNFKAQLKISLGKGFLTRSLLYWPKFSLGLHRWGLVLGRWGEG